MSTPDTPNLGQELRERLTEHIRLAERTINQSDAEGYADYVARLCADEASRFLVHHWSPRTIELKVTHWMASPDMLDLTLGAALLRERLYRRQVRTYGANQRRGYWLTSSDAIGELMQVERADATRLSNLVLATPALAPFAPIYLIEKDQP
jgi:hypothetical protein